MVVLVMQHCGHTWWHGVTHVKWLWLGNVWCMHFITFSKSVGDMRNDQELRHTACGWLPGAQSQQDPEKWQTQDQFLLPNERWNEHRASISEPPSKGSMGENIVRTHLALVIIESTVLGTQHPTLKLNKQAKPFLRLSPSLGVRHGQVSGMGRASAAGRKDLPGYRKGRLPMQIKWATTRTKTEGRIMAGTGWSMVVSGSYGLWMFVPPPPILMLGFFPQCDDIWRQGFWRMVRFRWYYKGGAPWWEEKKHMRTHGEGGLLQARKRSFPRTGIDSPFDIEFAILGGWRDGAVLNSTFWSCWGPRFQFSVPTFSPNHP